MISPIITNFAISTLVNADDYDYDAADVVQDDGDGKMMIKRLMQMMTITMMMAMIMTTMIMMMRRLDTKKTNEITH